MKMIKKTIDKFKRITRIYEGNIYELKDNENLFVSKKNIEDKINKKENIYYKRSLFTDLYVVELNTKKRIPTVIKDKFFRIPSNKFVLIEKKGIKFNEKQVEDKNVKNTYKIDEKKHSFSISKINLNFFKRIKLKGFELLKKLNDKKNTILKKKNKENNNKQEIKLLESSNKNLDIKYFEAENSIITEENINENVNIKSNEQVKSSELKNEKNVEKVIDVDYKILDKNTKNVENNREREIKKLKVLKNEILCDYWMKKQYPKKDIIILDKNNDITEIAKEMISLSNDNNIVKQTLNNIKLSTQILKTEEEIIAYYNYKLTGNKELFTEDVKTNCYKMLRIDRKLKR